MFKYLVIGSGLAGLYTAHRASALGSVLVVTKKALRDSNSFNAQGGIAAVTDIEDNPEIHFTAITASASCMLAGILPDAISRSSLYQRCRMTRTSPSVRMSP